MQEIVNRGFGKFPERDQPSFVLDQEKGRFREALTNKTLYGIYIYTLVTGPKGCGKLVWQEKFWRVKKGVCSTSTMARTQLATKKLFARI